MYLPLLSRCDVAGELFYTIVVVTVGLAVCTVVMLQAFLLACDAVAPRWRSIENVKEKFKIKIKIKSVYKS